MSRTAVQQIVREKTVNVDRETAVEQAVEAVMEFTPPDDGVSVYYVYVTDDDHLVGVASMRELLNAESTARVSEIMTTDLVSVTTSEPVREAIRRFIDNRFAVLPAVTETGAFVGVLRANDVIDALDEETTKQIFKQTGFWMS